MVRIWSAAICAAAGWTSAAAPALAQRALGLDVSYWQSEITQTAWNYAYNDNDRVFAMVRATRGGTTGLGQTSGTPGGGTQETLSRRYDDPRFIQNMVRANAAGLMTGPYHFARPDILTNTGADEADHFIQMAGIYMRPGYIMPMYDLEAGQAERTQQELAQFSLDFSNRIYEVMKIRPSIYANGNYMNDLSGANASTRNALAQPSSNAPTMGSPAFPVLFAARYPAGSGNPYTGDIQNQNPKDAGSTLSWFFGPFDDYGNSQPWHFWQYSSGEAPFGPHGDSTTDGDISQGDIEFVRDTLVPAVWWNDSNGDWSTLTNWNSGQPVVAPVPGPGQATPYATGPLPAARLPGAAGTGPTSGQYDTVILERPTADITVTISTGTHNVRKMYMREALNITGGSLTINYNPQYSNDFDNNPSTNFPNALRSGPISAQFSGPVNMSGGNLNVHTLQVDALQTFALSGGTLSFNTINLVSHNTTPAKTAVNGNVTINPLNNATATITNVAGGSTPSFVDLGGGVRSFNVGNGSAAIDLNIGVPIVNGGLTKSGPGTMQLSGDNTFAGDVTVNAGTLRYGHSSGLAGTAIVTVNSGATLDMNNISDSIAGLAGNGGAVLQGSGNLAIGAAGGSNTFSGTITGAGALNKTGDSSQTFTGNNTLGPVNVDGGSMFFNGTNTTGPVTVNSGGSLGGTGSVSGAVTVNSGGHIAPTSLDDFDVAELTLNAGSLIDFDLALPIASDRIDVSGLLTINGGTISISDPNGMLTDGTFTLIDYGTIAGDLASLGTPTGPAGFNYALSDNGSAIRLTVTSVPEGVPGDYNDDGMVDMGDYIVWVKNRDTENSLPNDNELGGTVGQQHYDLWLEHFGESLAGSGGEQTSGAVPEPSVVVSLLLGVCVLVFRRRRGLGCIS
jgi:autotransporter-associated beta strand protein